MSAKDWEEINELACSTIMLSLVETIYFNLADESRAYGVWHVQEIECIFTIFLAKEIGGFEDEGRDTHVHTS